MAFDPAHCQFVIALLSCMLAILQAEMQQLGRCLACGTGTGQQNFELSSLMLIHALPFFTDAARRSFDFAQALKPEERDKYIAKRRRYGL